MGIGANSYFVRPLRDSAERLYDAGWGWKSAFRVTAVGSSGVM
jgi:hypothetical protein